MKIDFYASEVGRKPVQSALESLSKRERAVISERLVGIRLHGLGYWRVGFKQVRGKLWEIKIRYRCQHRIFYVMKSTAHMILLHYINKKTQKLPSSDIALAEKRMNEVLNEND